MSVLVTKKFKLPNVVSIGESIKQDVAVVSKPQFDYSNSSWVSIDTEFLNLDINHDKLCLIQIASQEEDSNLQRIEMIWVYEQSEQDRNATETVLASILENSDCEVIMHVATADLPRIENYAATRLAGKLFDTKVGAKIAITNTNSYGMQDLVQNLVDPKFNKDKSTTFSQWDLHPDYWTDRMIEYAMLDVYYLHTLKSRLEEIAQRRNLAKLVKETMAIMPTVCELQKHGYSENVLKY